MMHDSSLLLPFATWLLTYLAHSTVLIAAVAVTTRWITRKLDRTNEFLWKVAVVGGIVTATFQVTTDLESASIGRELRDDLATVAPVAVPESIVGSRSGESSRSVFTHPDTASMATFEEDHTQSQKPISRTERRKVATLSLRESSWSTLATLALLTLSLGGLRVVIGRFQVRRYLGHRGSLEMIEPRRLLAEIANAARFPRPIALSVSDTLQSPIAFGIVRPEICLPRRALTELDHDQLRGILAHEVAHLVAQDPLWLQILHVIRVGLFLQPMNRLAYRKIKELSEFRCDAWATLLSEEPLHYADGLARVASWVVPTKRDSAIGVAAMAHQPSSLKTRVARILEEDGERRSSPRPLPRWTTVIAGILLFACATLAPGIRAAVLGPPANDTLVVGSPTEQAATALISELDGLSDDIERLRAKLAQHGLETEFAVELDQVEALRSSVDQRRRFVETTFKQRPVRR